MVRGLFGSLVVTTSVPVSGPDTVGVKVTFIVQLTDVVMGNAVQVLDGKVKSPVVSMSEISSGSTPTLDRTMLTGLLVVFTPWFPKESDVGVTDAAGDLHASAGQRNNQWDCSDRLLEMISDPVSAPETVGV